MAPILQAHAPETRTDCEVVRYRREVGGFKFPSEKERVSENPQKQQEKEEPRRMEVSDG